MWRAVEFLVESFFLCVSFPLLRFFMSKRNEDSIALKEGVDRETGGDWSFARCAGGPVKRQVSSFVYMP